MALDATMLVVAADELRTELTGARIEKITMPSRDEALFLMRTPAGNRKLLLSARAGSARAHITADEFENPAVPPAFCMLLRKHLASSRLTGLRTIDGERVLLFDFDALNEMGDRVSLTLSVELMGRYSNLVLVNGDGHVIDALKRIDFEQSDLRQLLPGVTFTLPPPQDKLPFMSSQNQAIIQRIAQTAKPLSEALLGAVAGLSPVLSREAAYRVGDPDADRMSQTETAALAATLDFIRSAARGEHARCLQIVYDGEKPAAFSFIALMQYGDRRIEQFERVGDMLDRFYGEKDRAERARIRSNNILRTVSSLRDRAMRKQQARLEESGNTEAAETKKLYGELLQANLHALKKGEKQAALLNYYNGETVTIPLDVTKTPIQNAQKYYKEYRKLTTAATVLERLLADGADEITYLDSVRYEIENAKTSDDFSTIRAELRAAGYLRGQPDRAAKIRRKDPGFLRFRTGDGFTVLVGRNNEQNDRLTLRIADRRDVWFHVKNAPGSHVVLATENRTPPTASLTQAAQLAAYYSSLRGGQNISVDYTAIKNIKKAPGQRAGLVYYENYETAIVTPDKTDIQNMSLDINI